MKHREIGQTGVKISEVGFSGWMIKGDGQEATEKSGQAIIAALNLGCSFFSTADIYGQGASEKVFGRVLEKYRNQVVLATAGGQNFSDPGQAVSDFSASYIASAIEVSCDRLKSKKIDMYLLYHPSRDVLENAEEVASVLEEFKSKERIGLWGVSVLDPEEGKLALDLPGISVIQVSYNLLDRRAEPLIAMAKKKGIGVIGSEPLAWGMLVGKVNPDIIQMASVKMAFPPVYIHSMQERINDLRMILENSERTLPQAALRFVLDNKGISSCIVACELSKHVKEDLAASEAGSLSDQEIKRIKGVFLG